MRRIFDKMVYDTDTAERVYCWDNGFGDSDFRQCTETLCKTPNGRWFLWGSGGPNSPWREQHGNMFGGGEGLRAISPDEALEWMESHQVEAKMIERHFEVKKA